VTTASQCDRDRFEVQPHNSALEQTADSQEKAAGDAAPGDDFPKPPPPSRKKKIEPKLVLVSSSGEPFGPKSHVSLKVLALRFLCLPVSSPEGESKCLHLGLPSEQLFEISSLLLLD
jgi:hypothetical protein